MQQWITKDGREDHRCSNGLLRMGEKIIGAAMDY